jgi:hypothetical protein
MSTEADIERRIKLAQDTLCGEEMERNARIRTKVYATLETLLGRAAATELGLQPMRDGYEFTFRGHIVCITQSQWRLSFLGGPVVGMHIDGSAAESTISTPTEFYTTLDMLTRIPEKRGGKR